LVCAKENIYFTDSRYLEEAKKQLKGAAIVKKVNGSVFKLIADSCLALGLKRIAFEGRYLAFAEYEKIKQGLKAKADLISTHSLVEDCRQIKETGELKHIEKAVRITIQALKMARRFIRPGRKEIEIAGELERFIRYHGAAGSAFEIIVASGPNSAFPHHTPGRRKLRLNEPVLIDIGVDYNGYKSDLTRVFFLGKINVLARKIYKIVLQAQELAIEKIRPGRKLSEIDAASRQFITREGFGEFFGHNLGHGIGLDVHEEPHLGPKEDNTLKPGMVVTVEPAIYLPGKFGIRLEDTVLVTKKGAKVLSGALHK
jgi:Xaa-Pro aminopeptidase